MSPEDETKRARKDRINARLRQRYAEDPEFRERRRASARAEGKQGRQERWESAPELRQKANVQSKLSRWRNKYKIEGMTIERFERMSARQGGACKICRRETPGEVLSLDHRHATGWVRGLLCKKCNFGLGSFEDNPVWLIRAAAYVTISLIVENTVRLFTRLRRLCRRALDSGQFRSGPRT